MDQQKTPRTSGAFLMGGKSREAAPAIAQTHPYTATHAGLDSPTRCSSRTLLHSSSQHQISSIYRPPYSCDPSSQIKARPPSRRRAQKEVSQQFASNRQAPIGAPGPQTQRQPGSAKRAKSAVASQDAQNGIRKRRDGLDPELPHLLGAGDLG